jgi:hypothetical protein
MNESLLYFSEFDYITLYHQPRSNDWYSRFLLRTIVPWPFRSIRKLSVQRIADSNAGLINTSQQVCCVSCSLEHNIRIDGSIFKY